MNKAQKTSQSEVSRRDFIKHSATGAAALTALAGGAHRIFAAGSDTVRVGLLGCGSRGTGAALNCLDGTRSVDLVALADVFPDKLEGALKALKQKFPDRVKVTKESRFTGFDSCEKLVAHDLDIVIMATPPGFRPQQLKAAIEGGRHVFMEKPGGVDPVGIRSLMASSELAEKKGLSIVVGTQQRRQYQYLEIMKRIRDGQIGEIVGGESYWHWGSSKWHFQQRRPGWSDMEWQIRCWPYFVWLSGDHIVEQHLHNIDVINWAMGSHPVQCLGIGGRQARTGPEFGNIYDHFAVEFEYPGGIRVASYSSQIEGSSSRVGERVVGSKGWTFTTRGSGEIFGERPYKYEGKMISGLEKEHADLVESVRQGKPINEGKRLAESTMTVILGRMSAYTGRAIKWDWAMKKSQLDLRPKKVALGSMPVAPVAIPGKTKLI